MSYLFFDSETSGLPQKWKAPVSDFPNWPRLVQLAWVVCGEGGEDAVAREYIIRPEGFEISPGSTQVHGITTERALAEGVALKGVLDEFAAAVADANALVAHNISFDEKIIGAEFLRGGAANVLEGKTRRCTMKESVDYCQLPGNFGFKWPTLSELHTKLFGVGFDEAHNALADCNACMKCFFRLKSLGEIA
jgi:DNA polymerase III epsilon subunit-like protein